MKNTQRIFYASSQVLLLIFMLFASLEVVGQTCTPDITSVSVTLDSNGNAVFTQPGVLQNDTGAECCDGTTGGNVDCVAITFSLPPSADEDCFYSSVSFQNDQGNIYVAFVDPLNICSGITSYGNNQAVQNTSCDGGGTSIVICKPGNLTVSPTVDIGLKCNVVLNPPAGSSICNVSAIPTAPTDFNAFLDAGGSFNVTSNITECGNCSDVDASDFSNYTVSDSGSIGDVCVSGQSVVRTFSIDYCGVTLSTSQTFTSGGSDCPGCCAFETTCPAANTSLGTFDCTTLANIPAMPTTEAAAEAAPYGITIGDEPCGTIVVQGADSGGSVNVCAMGGQTITRTITVFDDLDADNTLDADEDSEVCTFQYTITEDTTIPTVSCPAVTGTFDCNTTTLPSAFTTIAAFTGAGGVATDNCTATADLSIASSDAGTIAGLNFCSATAADRTITRTYTITDACGNENTCDQLFVFAQDTEGAQVVCPTNVTTGLDCTTTALPAAATDVASFVALGGNITDNCPNNGTITVSSADAPAITALNFCSADASARTITRTYTITDGCGITTTCNQLFVFAQDVAAPTITCPANVTTGLDCTTTALPAAATTAAAFETAGGAISDVCSADADITVASEDAPGIANLDFCSVSPAARTITRTYTITDECGNEATCDQLFVFSRDVTSPVIGGCPSDLNMECGSAYATQINTWISAAETAIMAASTDVCDNSLTVSNNYVAGSLPPPGCAGAVTPLSVTFTVTDDCGNFSTCSADITITDTTVPSITCPDPLTITACNPENNLIVTNWLTTVSGSDACGGTVSFSNDLDFADLDACMGAVTVEFTATDDCGLQATCTQDITIGMANDPELLFCPNNSTVGIDGSACTISATFTPPIAIDECGPVTVVQDSGPVSGATTGWMLGANPIEFTITNSCGKSIECDFVITIVDQTTPTIECPGEILVCAPAGSCTWTGAGLDPTTAACNNTTLSYTLSGATSGTGTGSANGEVFNIGITTVDYTVTNTASGLEAFCDVIVIVEDCEPPTINCPADVTNVACGSEDIATWAASALASDDGNCSDVVIEYVLLTQSELCGETQSSTYLFTATDEAGNMATCTATYATIDEVPPVIITAAAPETAECGMAVHTELLAWLSSNGGAVANDACGEEVFWTNNYNGSLPAACGNTGVISVNFTATDACGNQSVTSSTFTIQDTTAPSIFCPDNLDLECGAENNDDIVINWLASAYATDNCTDVTVSNNFTALPACGASTMVTFTVENNCDGQTITCMASISVVDTQKPIVMNVPEDLYVECDGTGNTADINNWLASFGGMLVFDACDGMIVPSTPIASAAIDLCSGGGTSVIPYTFTATDACGNNSIDEVAYVHILDTTAPSFTVTPAGPIECNTANPDIWAQGAVTSIVEVCGTTTTDYYISEVNNTCDDGIEYTYTFVVTDQCGNSTSQTSTYQVVDSTPPVLTPPSDLTLDCTDDISAEILAWLNSYTVSDNCDADPQVTNNFNGTPPTCGSSVTITWTATDDCSNTINTATATITVNDNTAPVLTVPDNITVECGTNQAAIIEAWENDALAIDNCDGTVEVTFIPSALVVGTCPNTGVITYTFDAQDACGNMATQLTRTVTIIDSQKPVIMTPPSDVIVECDGAGNIADLAAFEAAFGGMMAMDNCNAAPILSFVAGTATTTCGGTQTIPYTFTATDACGNAISEVANLVIIDTTDPVVVPPAPLAENCGSEDLEAWALMATATDVCNANPQITYAIIEHTEVCTVGVGFTETFTVAFTATDNCGNQHTLNSTYTVQDIVAPVFDTPPADLVLTCGDDVSASISAWLNTAVVSDNCGTVTVTNDWDGTTPDLCGDAAGVTVTFTASDGCLETTATATITSNNDTAGPTFINCPANMTVAVDVDLCTANVIYSTPIAEDCNGATVAFTSGIASGEPFPLGDTDIVFTATDGCNNTSTCEFTITVIDSQNPVINCPPSINVCADDGTCTWLATTATDPTFADCTNTNLSYEIVDPMGVATTGTGLISAAAETFAIGSNTVTYTLTDSGDPANTSICSFTVEVENCTSGYFDLASVWCQEAPASDPLTFDFTLNENLFFEPSTATITLTSDPVGFITGSGTDWTFDPAGGVLNNATQGVSNVTITLEVDNGEGCEVLYSQEVIVYQTGDPTFALQETVCETETMVALALTTDTDDGVGAETMIPDFVTWTGSGVTENADGITANFDPSSVGVGTYEICVTVGAPNCEEIQCNTIVVEAVPPLPEAESIEILCAVEPAGTVSLSQLFTGVSAELLDSSNPDVTITVSGGSAILVGGAVQYTEAGCYSVQWQYTDSGACGLDRDVTSFIFVSEQPTPSFDLPEQYCWDGAVGTTIQATVNSPAAGNSYDPFGTLTVDFSTTNPAIATIDDDGLLTIISAGTVSICYLETLTTSTACGTDPAGGVFPARACSEQTCQTITITETADAIDASWDLIGPFCVDDATDYDLTPTGTPNGDFTGQGVTEEFNGGNEVNEYTFSPEDAGVGIHSVCYTISNGSGCEAVLCRNIEVLPTADATINDLVMDCSIDPDGNISLDALFTVSTTEGGTFTLVSSTGTNADASVIGNTLQYNAPGCYVIEYEVSSTSLNGTAPSPLGTCTAVDQAIILIPEEPQPDFGITNEFCWDGSDVNDEIAVVLGSPVYDFGLPTTYAWTTQNATGDLVVSFSDASVAEPIITIESVTGSGTIEVCLTETITNPGCSDDGGNPVATDVDCSGITCHLLTVTETADFVDASWDLIGPFCVDDATDYDLTPTGTPNGEFTGQGVTENENGGSVVNTYTFSPADAGVGIHTICYTIGNNDGCDGVQCRNIEVLPTVDATINDLVMDCSIDPDGNISLDALFTVSTTEGGTFTLVSSTGTNADASVIGNTLQYNAPGCYVIEYEVSSTSLNGTAPSPLGTCTAVDQAIILIPEEPQPDFGITNEFCWDGSDVNDEIAVVLGSPVYDFGLPTTYAWTTQNATGDLVVSFSDASVAEPIITIESVTGSGTIEVCLTETITNPGCSDDGGNPVATDVDCSGITCHLLTVTETADFVDASWDLIGPFCVDDATDYDLTPTGTPNGEFTGQGVTENENGGSVVNTYTFSPADAGVGIHTICYTIGNNDGCDGVQCRNIEVLPTVDATINDLVMDCSIDPDGNISLDALFTVSTTEGGTFTLVSSTGTNADASVIGNTLQYNAPGCYVIEYEVSSTSLNGTAPSPLGTCTAVDQAIILIPEEPQPDFGITNEFCWDGSDVNDEIAVVLGSPVYDFGLPTTYAWTTQNATGDLVVSFSDASVAEPIITIESVTGSGTIEVCLTETITNPGCSDDGGNPVATDVDCSGITCHLLTVTETADFVDASWDLIGPFCVDDATDYDLTPTGTPNGEFTGQGVTENENGGSVVNTYTFSPADAGVGIHTICYTIGNNDGCDGVQCRNIEVLPTVNADINNLTLDCSIDPSGSISLSSMFTSTTTVGGTFTIDGVETNTLNYDGPGCYIVTYEVTSNSLDGTAPNPIGACTDTDVATIYILEEPQPSFDMPEEVCFGEGGPSIDINAFVNSPTYDTFGILTGVWELTTSEPTITLTDNGISGAVITVDGDITTSVTVTLCYTETLSFTGCDDDGVAGNNDDDASQADTSCDATYCETLTINDSSDTVDPSFDQVGPFCITDADFYLGAINGAEGVVTGQLGGEFTGSAVYEGSAAGVPATGTSQYWFSPLQAGQGIHSITYTVSSQEGCTASFTQNVVVYETVNVTAAVSQSSYCLADSNIDFSILFSSTGDGGITDFDDDDGEYYLNGTAYFGADLAINPSLVGVHIITYCVGNSADITIFNTDGTIANTFTDCTTCAQASIEICDTPDASWQAPAFLCEDGGSPDPVFIDEFIGSTYPLIPTNLGVQGDDYTSYSWFSEAGQLFFDEAATQPYNGESLTTETIYFLPAGLSDQSEVEICLTVIGAGELQENGMDLCEGCSATRCYEIPIVSEYQADLNLNSEDDIAICLEDFLEDSIKDLTQYLSNTTPGNGYFTITHHGADGILGTADDVVAENCSLGGTIVGCQDGFIWDISTLGSSGLDFDIITITYTVEGSDQCTRYDQFTLILEAPAEDCFEPDPLICENDFGNPIDAYNWLVEGCISCDTTWISNIHGAENSYNLNYQSSVNLVNNGIQLPGNGACSGFINPDIAVNTISAPLIPEGAIITYLKFRWSYEGTCETSEGDLDSATILFPSGNELMMGGLPYPNDGGPNGNDHYGWQEFVITGDLLNTYAAELDYLTTCESIDPFEYIVQSNSANWTIGFEVEIRWNTCSFEAYIHETADEDGFFNDTIPLPYDANMDGDYLDALDIPGGFYQTIVEDENGDSQVQWVFDSNGLNAIDGVIDVVFNNAICGDCPSQEVQSILVAENYGAAFITDVIDVCSSEGTIDLTQYLASSSDNGGNFSSDDVMINGDILALGNVTTADGCVDIIYDVADFVNTCGQASDTLTLCVIPQESIPDLSGIDGEQVCEGVIIDLSAYQDGTWTSSNSIVNSDLNADQTVLNTTGYSQYNPISLTYTLDGVCGNEQTITVIVESSFDAVLSEDIDACIGNLGDAMVVSVQPDGTECIDLDQFVSEDATTAPNFGAGFWSLTSDNGTLSGAILCPDGSGVYDLVYTIPGSGDCGAVRDMTITINEQEDAMFILPDLLCSSEVLELSADGLIMNFTGQICVSGDTEPSSIQNPSFTSIDMLSLSLPEIAEGSKILGLEVDYNYVGFGNANGDFDTIGISLNGVETILGLPNGTGPNGDNHFDFDESDNIVFTEGAGLFETIQNCSDNSIELGIVSNSALWDACINVSMSYTTGTFTATLPSGESLETYGYDNPIIESTDGSGSFAFDATSLCDVDQVLITFERFGCTACGNNTSSELIDIVCGGQANLIDDTTICYVSEIDLDAYLADGTSANGSFSGVGVSGDVLTPLDAGVYFITYEYGEPGSLCYSSDEIEITILPEINSEFSLPATLCSLDGDSWDLNDYLSEGAATNGTWSISLGGADLDGSILSSNDYTGLIELSYTVDNGVCSGTSSQILEIVKIIDASLEIDQDVCWSEFIDLTQFFDKETTIGGVFSGDNAIDGYSLYPNQSGGIYTITYSVGDPESNCGVESDEITITVQPAINALWDGPSSFCSYQENIDLTNYLTSFTDSDGAWSIYEGGGDISGNIYNPDGYSGILEIHYTVNNGACSETHAEIITVIAPISPESFPSIICVGESIDLSQFEVTEGGTWFGSGVSENIFNATSAGNKIVYYEVGGSSCGNIFNIEVSDIPEVLEVPAVEAVCAESGEAPVFVVSGGFFDHYLAIVSVDGVAIDTIVSNTFYGASVEFDPTDVLGEDWSGMAEITFYAENQAGCLSNPISLDYELYASPELTYLIGCTDPVSNLAALTVGGLSDGFQIAVYEQGTELDITSYNPMNDNLAILNAGIPYNIYAIDGNGCTAFIEGVKAELSLSYDASISCADENGMVTISIDVDENTGYGSPYEYSYDGGLSYSPSSSMMLLVEENPTVSVSVRDAKGCLSEFEIFDLGNSGELSSEVSCNDNGIVNIDLGYTGTNYSAFYEIEGIAYPVLSSNFSIEVDEAKPVFITVIDNSSSVNGGCILTDEFMVYPELLLNVEPDYNDCPQGDVNTLITASGGFGSYDLSIDGEMIANFSAEIEASLGAGEHEIMITDANGCSQSMSITIESANSLSTPVLIYNNSLSSATSVCGSEALSLEVTGGSTYEWSIDGVVQSETGNVLTTSFESNSMVSVVSTDGACASEALEIPVTYYPVLSSTEAEITCLEDGTYSVNFEISGGNITVPYIVESNGVVFESTGIVSAIIDINEAYNFNISSPESGCALNINGNSDCPDPNFGLGCEPDLSQGSLDCEAGQVTVFVSDAGSDFEVLSISNGATFNNTVTDGFGGVIISFAIEDNTAASFTMTYNAGGVLCDGTDTYEISIDCGNVTAIELLRFDGEVLAEGNQLSWITAQEVDADYFTLERSIDGVNFEAIANVNAHGNSSVPRNYEHFDMDASVGDSFYRLLETDINGVTSIVSNVIELNRLSANTFVIDAVYPVPASDQVNIEFDYASKGQIQMNIYNVFGQLVDQKAFDVVSGTNIKTIDISEYTAGTYFISLVNDGSNNTNAKFIVE